MKGYQQFIVKISGEDYIPHNGQMADPLNPFARAMKEISGKRKKTEADHSAMADIEFIAGLYTNESKQVIIPGRVLEAWIAEGARKSKEGKVCLSSTFVDTDALLHFDGDDMTIDQLKASEAHRLKVAVKVGQAKVMRTRPHFHNWSGEFKVSINLEMANPAQLKRWIEDAATYLGIGDWRPRHGRCEIVKFETVSKGLKAAA